MIECRQPPAPGGKTDDDTKRQLAPPAARQFVHKRAHVIVFIVSIVFLSPLSSRAGPTRLTKTKLRRAAGFAQALRAVRLDGTPDLLCNSHRP